MSPLVWIGTQNDNFVYKKLKVFITRVCFVSQDVKLRLLTAFHVCRDKQFTFEVRELEAGREEAAS